VIGLALISIVVAALLSWALLAWLLPRLRSSLLDQPNARSSHRQPTPRGGGIAFVLIGSAGALVQGAVLPLLVLPLALVGLRDDRRGLPPWLRYGVQLATAVALLTLTRPAWLPWALAPLALIAITAIINFINFTDGLDGLVGACMAVSLAAAALVLPAPWLWPLVGALLGFLLWNWSPAQVFMGDVGSTFLGALFAGVVSLAPDWRQALGLLLVATPLLADAFLCVLRRLAAGQPVFEAHRLHLFQRLQQAGWSHGRVAACYATATALLAVALIAGRWSWMAAVAGMEILVGVWLDARVAVPFEEAVCSQVDLGAVAHLQYQHHHRVVLNPADDPQIPNSIPPQP